MPVVHFAYSPAQGPRFVPAPRSWSRWGRGDSADLPEQAQGVPVDPFFNELAVGDPAEQLPVHVDRLAGRSGTLQFPAVGTAQRPVGFHHVALGDLAFDPQVEVMQDAAVPADPLLESLRAGALTGVI